MAEVQAVSPAGSRSMMEPRPPSQSGSRSSSRVGFTESAHSRHSSGRIKYVPAHRPPSNARSTPSSTERPASVRSLREKKELNEYLSPIVKTAVRRWKRFHEQKVIERFKERRESKKQRVKDIKEEKKKLARRIPIDALAVEWLNRNELTVDARAYLLEKLLPTLILGTEKLLIEAERRDLTEKNEADPNFNPLNYLAQYLMRNNPRYSNFPEASPYIRGMQEVTDELKQYVFSFEDNRLARVKAETRRKREQMERTEALQTQEKSRRSAHIRRQYKDWLLDPEGMVEQRAIQNSLTSFREVLENLPEEFKKASDFLAELDKLDANEEQFHEEEFAQYLKKYVLKLAPELYDSLMSHMAQCAVAYRHAAVLEARRDILLSLFTGIDNADVGILNRHRVLGLFENFWENVPWSIKRHLRNPRKWPVIELNETDETESIFSVGSSISSVKTSSIKELEPEPDVPSEGAIQTEGEETVTGEDGAAPAVVEGGEASEEGAKDEVKQDGDGPAVGEGEGSKDEGVAPGKEGVVPGEEGVAPGDEGVAPGNGSGESAVEEGGNEVEGGATPGDESSAKEATVENKEATGDEKETVVEVKKDTETQDTDEQQVESEPAKEKSGDGAGIGSDDNPSGVTAEAGSEDKPPGETAEAGSDDKPPGVNAEAGCDENPPGETAEAGSDDKPPGVTAEAGSDDKPPGETAEAGSDDNPPGETAEAGSDDKPPGVTAEAGSDDKPPGETAEAGSDDKPPGETAETGETAKAEDTTGTAANGDAPPAEEAPPDGAPQEEAKTKAGGDESVVPEIVVSDDAQKPVEESEQPQETAESVQPEEPAPAAETAEGAATEPQPQEQEPPAAGAADAEAAPTEAAPAEATPGEAAPADSAPVEAVPAEGEKKEAEDVASGDQAANSAEEAKAGEDKSQELTSSAKERGNLLPTTANTQTGRSTSVSFREDAIKLKEEKADSEDGPKSPVKTPTVRSGSRTGSVFDESALNSSQFVQLVELFLGEDSPQYAVDALVKFITEGYVETEQEKFLRLQQARREAESVKRRQMVDQLFDKWDNDGSGYLDLEEFHSIMAKFKDNMESRIMAKAKQKLEKEELDNRLSKQEFKAYVEAVCSLLPGGPDNFDPLIDFLMTSVERSYEERIRGQARKKWLASIIQAAETSAGGMQPVYKGVFNSLYKDADQHGRGKRISANIGLLERNDVSPARGPTCLRYVAATPDDAGFMLNKILHRDMKGISFSSIDSGKPIHVPRVQNHGSIMFWNPERADEKYKKISIDDYDPARDRQGSFLVIPLKDFRKRVFGLMGIDTLNDPHDKSIFITHEISFFQGVAKSFSTAYQYVEVRRKTLRIAESAVSWIHRRSPHVQEINVFLVEPDDKIDDFVLRRMITTDKKGTITVHERPSRLERKENLFRDYLFKTVDNSETVTADAYGQRHLAFPLRDVDGRCLALVDLSIGDLKQLPGHENKEVQRMLKLLQAAHKEVSQESTGGDRKIVLEAEKGSEESRIDIMFDRIMLTDLRNTVSKLNAQAFAELKSYKDPPKVIHSILVSVLALFYRDKYEEGELDAWNTCKQFVGPELIKKIEEFDPTAQHIPGIVEMISKHLKDVPHGAVAKHGSLPAQNLYNWAFVCLSLLEHTSKMTKNKPPGMPAPPGTAASGEVRTIEQ
ncbi:EF-hand calcium-binding domain-containing protein 5 isoform X3 [Strongylocentrotus purpuratus]|uniref:EF-hand domain-containing protein n=1 Tax=Strongylocentrotus purpuratus TaxID=7668 RepID=A0A7M7PD10_STRPU|nr:EF-hand calcium-binding domain-containing protein 5 isoform X3 [Strongylocentrotus purpuratus]